jgi:hypothetical protein
MEGLPRISPHWLRHQFSACQVSNFTSLAETSVLSLPGGMLCHCLVGDYFLAMSCQSPPLIQRQDLAYDLTLIVPTRMPAGRCL